MYNQYENYLYNFKLECYYSIKELEYRIAEIDAILSNDSVKDRVSSALSVIQNDMTTINSADDALSLLPKYIYHRKPLSFLPPFAIVLSPTQ